MAVIKEEETIRPIIDSFKYLDKENIGFVTKERFCEFITLNDESIDVEQGNAIFENINSVNEGLLTISEFVGPCLTTMFKNEGYEVWFAFKFFEHDKGGISLESIEEVYEGRAIREKVRKEMIEAFENNYGKISGGPSFFYMQEQLKSL